MPKTSEQYLEQHDGDATAALNAAVRDVAQRESQAKAARAFKRAYTPLVEALELPAEVDPATEQEASNLAAQALDSLASDGPDEASDAAAALLEELTERLGLDFSTLERLSENATDAEVDAALDAALAPVTGPLGEVQTLKRDATYRAAADAQGWDAAKLQRIVPNLTAREVEQDGQKVPEYGVLDGDKWTPLTDAASGFEAALKRDAAQPDKPAPAPLPTGQRGTAAKPKTAEQIASEKRARPEYTI